MNTPDDWTPDERRLSDALRRAADQVIPAPDGLARIRERTARARQGWRRPLALGLAAAAAAAAVVIGGVALFGGDDDPIAVVDTPSPVESPSDEPASSPGVTDAPTPSVPAEGPPTGDPVDPSEGQPGGETVTVPVYYAVDTSAGPRLAREFHAVSTSTSAVEAALRQMGGDPADPDYATLWPGVSVQSVGTGDPIHVDLATSPALPGDASREQAELAVQQIVYTATATASMHREGAASAVLITVDGEPAADLFGQLDVSEPVTRADPLEVRQLVQINNPAEGTNAASPVTVDGEGAAFEANLEWEVRRDGAVVENGFTTAEMCCEFAPFEFTVDLGPGVYEIVVSEVDVSGGEGRPPMSDSKTFTVR